MGGYFRERLWVLIPGCSICHCCTFEHLQLCNCINEINIIHPGWRPNGRMSLTSYPCYSGYYHLNTADLLPLNTSSKISLPSHFQIIPNKGTWVILKPSRCCFMNMTWSKCQPLNLGNKLAISFYTHLCVHSIDYSAPTGQWTSNDLTPLT